MRIIVTASRDIKEEIVQEFKDIVMGIDFTTPEDINRKISDITKKLRRLYMHGRDE